MTTVNNSSVSNSVVTIKAFDFGKIKSSFKSAKTIYNKVTKLQEKIDKLNAEIEIEQEKLNALNSYCVLITKGYTPQDLVKEVVTDTDNVDKNGNVIKAYSYVPSDIVTFNEAKKVYEVKPLELNSMEEAELDTEEVDNLEVKEMEKQIEDVESPEEVIEESKEAQAEDVFGDSQNFADPQDVNFNNIED